MHVRRPGWDLVSLVLLFIVLRPAQAVAVSMLPKRPAGRLTLEQLRALATQTGFADPITAAAVAMAESGGNPAAVNDTRGRTDLPAGTSAEWSLGLWQVNVLAHPDFDAAKLTDPAYNASAALQISNGGTDWKAWSVYTSGAYRAFMPAI